MPFQKEQLKTVNRNNSVNQELLLRLDNTSKPDINAFDIGKTIV